MDGPLLIYGAGGYGLVVAEAASAAGWRVRGFLDDQRPVESVGTWRVFNGVPEDAAGAAVIIAIGDNMARRRIAADMVSAGLRLVSVVHPTAWISPSAIIGQGVYVGAKAVINGQAQIDNGAIINTAAVVEHHCRVAGFAHIAPNVVLMEHVTVGALALVGPGAVVKTEITIGEDARVGAGAAVVGDVIKNEAVAGVPAKPIK